MSKTRIKTPAIKAGGVRQSDKVSKRIANRKFRRIEKQKISDPPRKVREVSDNWNFNSDGLAIYCNDLPEKYLRK